MVIFSSPSQMHFNWIRNITKYLLNVWDSINNNRKHRDSMYSLSFLAIRRRLPSTPGTSLHWQTWTLLLKEVHLLVWGSTVSAHPSSGVCSEPSWSISATLCLPLLSQTVSVPTVVIPHFAEEKELWLRDIKKPAKEQNEISAGLSDFKYPALARNCPRV